MQRLTRHIMKRMITNFIVLFTLFFLLGAVIDIIVNLDEFVNTADQMSAQGNIFSKIFSIIRVVIGFEGPRFFQVFAYLHGMIAIGAMAFTASTMLKSREFVAIMAVGISLRQIAVPFLVIMSGISAVALLNQEFILPKVAPLLLRDHGESGKQTAKSFNISFTPDKKGALLIAPSLNPSTGELTEPSFLERDDRGRMVRQIQALSAFWDTDTNLGWKLNEGRAVEIIFDQDTTQATILAPTKIDFYPTDLSPYVLTLHRYGQYVDMLGMSQLNNMLEVAGSFDAPMLRRHWYARFASIAMNMLAMIIVIPLFITREPVVLSKQAVKCGGIAMSILLGGMIIMLMPIEGIPAMVSVFLPAIILLPLALLRIVSIRT